MSVCYEQLEFIPKINTITKGLFLGLDFSCKEFYVDSNGNFANYENYYLENEERLTEFNKNEIRDCLTGLKYWLTDYDGRQDSMCFWSENHQILFAVTEYLTGNEWPDVYFADGRKGSSHVESAKERINAWMEQRFYYGFNEYYSNNYYIEDIAPMANFIEFAVDEDMVNRMKIIMDLLWYDVASQSYKYVDVNGKTNYAFMSAS